MATPEKRALLVIAAILAIAAGVVLGGVELTVSVPKEVDLVMDTDMTANLHLPAEAYEFHPAMVAVVDNLDAFKKSKLVFTDSSGMDTVMEVSDLRLPSCNYVEMLDRDLICVLIFGVEEKSKVFLADKVKVKIVLPELLKPIRIALSVNYLHRKRYPLFYRPNEEKQAVL